VRRPMGERDLVEWDAEIEADFQRAVAATKAAGKRKRGGRHMGAPWSVWVACRERELPWAAVVLAVYIFRRTQIAGCTTVTLQRAELDELKMTRFQRSRMLRLLVEAGLVQRRSVGHGQASQVTWLLP
jgi:hypothetical protein